MKLLRLVFNFLILRIKLRWHGIPIDKFEGVNLPPPPGYSFNPLLKYPPNINCFCGTYAKAKKCCLPKLKRIIPERDAIPLRTYIEYIERRRDELF